LKSRRPSERRLDFKAAEEGENPVFGDVPEERWILPVWGRFRDVAARGAALMSGAAETAGGRTLGT